MPSSAHLVFGIYELLERILLQLGCIEEIIQAQRVCRNWKNVVQRSPALQKACWYRPHGGDPPEREDGHDTWKLNPVFNRIGVSVQKRPWRPFFTLEKLQRELGGFDFEERVYDKPGSWTTMLATQPPYRRIEIECYCDYGSDYTRVYLIESTTDCLLLGDVMAGLAECLNRQERAVDGWAGVRHYTGGLVPVTEVEWSKLKFGSSSILEEMPHNVLVKVAVEQAWGAGRYPSYSFRRLYPHTELVGYPTGAMCSLHELTLYKTIHDGIKYKWHGWKRRREKERAFVCKTGEYEANLLALEEEHDGYLAECSHIFRFLSDV